MKRFRLSPFALASLSVLVLLVATALPALAADIHWTNGAGGNWNLAANWNSGAGPVPGASDNAIIDQAGTYTVTLDVSPTVTSIALGAASGAQTLSGTSRTITIAAASTIGANGTLFLNSSTVAGTGSLDNQGTLVIRGTTAISVAYTTAVGSITRSEGNGGTGALTFANGFTNNGTIELTSSLAGYASTVNVTTGTLTNAAGANINVQAGAGGARTLGVQLDNQGTLTANAALGLNKTSADHMNSGTINLSNADMTLTESGTTPTFTNTGTITIGSGHTLTVNNGAFSHNAGSIGGAGMLSFNASTLNLGIDLDNATTGLNLSNSTVNGPGILTNKPGKTLILANSTVNAALANQDTLVCRGGTDVNGTFTSGAGSYLRVEANNGASILTFATGFTNNGTIDMMSVGAGYSTSLNVTTGTLTNAVGANINALAGAGGARTLSAQLDNQGTLTVNQPLALNKSSADHLSSGTIDLSNESLTLTMGGLTPTFTNTGTITIGSGHTLTVFNGVFSYDAGSIGGVGSVSFSSTTWNLGVDFNNSTTGLDLANATVNGPSTLTNSTGRTLLLANSTVNAPFVNQGTLIAHGSTTIGGTFTNTPTSSLRSEGSNGASILTFANGFTNLGTIDITSVVGGYTAALNVTAGTLTNAVGANINVLVDAGGPRSLGAQIDNQGTMTVSQPLTLSKISADHLNSGTIYVNNDTDILMSGTTPTFTTTGTITIAAGHSLSVSSGVFHWNAGTLGGPGTLSFGASTWNLGLSFTNDVTDLVLSNTIVNGPGTLTNATGKTLILSNDTINAPLVNQETLIGRGSTAVNGTFTMTPSSLLTAEGNNGSALLTFANGFTNIGTIDLTSAVGAYASLLNVTAGTLTNAPGGTIHASAGVGGSRSLGAELDNQGTMTVTGPLTIAKLSAHHLNSGTLDIEDILTLTQSGSTPTFTSTGTITIGPGHIFHVNAGAVTNALGGILQGTGTLELQSATFSNAGAINPGTSPGIFSVTGASPFASTGSLNVELGGPTVGTNYDRLAVSGLATLNGAINATLVNGFTPAIGDSFVVVTAGSTAGQFSSQNLPALGGGLEFRVGYRPTSVVLTVVNPTSTTIGINNVSVVEGNAGTVNAVFTVSLSAPSAQTVTVDYATADNVATSPADYVSSGTQTLTFTPGMTSQPVTVVVNGDVLDEADETFFVNLSNPANATIAAGQGIGTITDDDATPTLSINDVTVTEGNAGTVSAGFTVTLSAASGRTVTVNYAAVSGTASIPADLAPTSGTLTFPAGTTTQPVTVTVNGDVLDEADETYGVNLSSAVNATIADFQGIGTITDDDPTPSLSINDVTVTEGNVGAVNAIFTVTLSGASGRTVTVHYATGDSTATSPADYATSSGTLSFPPGSTSQPATITVNGDALDEQDEVYLVNLSAPVNATIADAQGLGTITDDDPPPSISINDVTVTEGNAGTVNAVFAVTLSAASGQTVTVSYATADNSAISPADYAAQSGTVTFPPGSTSQPVTVVVQGDTDFEPSETFFVNLTTPGNAAIADGQGTGTITNDDVAAGVTLGIGNVTVTEGNAGTVDAVFTVTLSAPSAQTVTVDYTTSGVTATSPEDFVAGSGTVTFPPGNTSQPVTVAVKGDLLDEPDETFYVNLSNATNGSIATGQGTGTITDDDPTPSLSINDVPVTEGDVGTVPAVFTVTLSAASGRTVTVNYATSSNTAMSPADFVAASGTLTFPPGTTTQPLTVLVNGDLLDEADENFVVNLSSPVNATIQDGVAGGGIADNDPTPTISINDVTVAEGNAGTVNAVFTVTLSAPSGQEVRVGYLSADGTATAPADYVPSGQGTVIFPPGSTSQPLTVVVNGDTIDEADETFYVNLPGAMNATIADNQGLGTITDDDGPPTISINDVTVTEGDVGTVNAVFTVTLSAPSTNTVTVDFSTADNSATSPDDYAPGSGTLTFTPGTISQSVTVLVNGDTTDEPVETFFVNLTNATNATISDTQGQGTISNDDAVAQISPQKREYWRQHPSLIGPLLPVTLGNLSVTTVPQAQAILKFGGGPDWNHKLRAELMATLLNLAQGSVNGACVQPTVDDAQDFLDANGTKRLTNKKYKALVGTAHDLTLALRAYNDGHAPCFEGSAETVAEMAPEGSDLTLQPNYPNPFNGRTTIQYGLPAAAHARLVVYDVHGREVRVLVDESQNAGSHTTTWDGTDRNTTPVASGVYYYRLTAGESTQLGKMILTK